MQTLTDQVVTNPCGLRGIAFVEFAAPDPTPLAALFLAFGFSKTMHHARANIDLYQQGEMTFLLHLGGPSYAARFAAAHGPSIVAMGWRTDDAATACGRAVARGATAANGDLQHRGRLPVPAVQGIGRSLIYFIDPAMTFETLGFERATAPIIVEEKGFTQIDHLTNNVPHGELGKWGAFYKDVFGFTEVRYFDIRGVQTGLTSYALRSPDGSFCIPINEGTEAKSQINEYLEEYNGPGIQHLAFLTSDIIRSLRQLEGSSIGFLDIDADYYGEVFGRVPNVKEDHAELARRNILIDGDADGYLLQIFTKNLIGPIFIEIIQRQNHASFGEGNFGALFRSIERDQQRRGYLA